MILIDVSGASATVWKQDILTSGMVGAEAVFRFDEDWDAMGKTVVFRAGNITKDATVLDSIAKIPHEVLAIPGIPLEIGVYGTANDGAIVIPTIWASTRPIQPGADPSGDASMDPSQPAWSQMQEQLNHIYNTSEAINKAKEEMLEVIEKGKEDIKATVEAGGYYTKVDSGNHFASAFKGELSGEIVAARDVSPVEHMVGVKVQGRNLFNTTDDFTKTSATQYTYQNGVLTLSGSYVNKWIKVKTGKTYMFSAVSSRTGSSGGGVYIRIYKENKVDYKLVKYDVDGLSPAFPVTAVEGYPYVRITFYGSTKNDPNESATYSNIQLVEGAVATEYEPYIDPSTLTVSKCGKNLISLPYAYSARTVNGVTFTPNGDGSVTASGTATANAYFVLNGGFASEAKTIPNFFKAGQEYTLTGATAFFYTADGKTTAFGEGTFKIPDDCVYYGIFAYVPSGTAVSTVFQPQLEVGSNGTEFEPYNRTDYIPLQDGSVEGVVSLAPNMTLFADREGVTLDVLYNRDSNAVISELLNKVMPAAKISSATLLESAWEGSGPLHQQVVSIPGVTPYSKVDLLPSVEQLSIFHDKDLAFVTENEDGVVTVYALGDRPTRDYTMQVSITEVNV